MFRNLILLSLLILFWIGLHAQYHWIPIYKNKSQEIYMIDVSSENTKIETMKSNHKKARDQFIFTEMIANNNETIVNSLRENTKRFWNDKEGLNSKFNKFIKNTLLELDLKIDYRGSKTVKVLAKAGFEERHYKVDLECEYEDLIVFIAEIEKNNRIYNVEKLEIINSPQKNISGIKVELTLSEINIY